MLTRYGEVNSQVKSKIEECSRCADDVTLIAVSKTVGISEVEDAISQGAFDFGENRPDELMRKASAFKSVKWHFIGNIQSRQIKNIVRCAYMIHSLDKLEHAKKIDKAAGEINKIQKVLIEVNFSGEVSKGGVSRDNISQFLEAVSEFKNLEVCGLMTMAPIQNEQNKDLPSPREVFKGVRDVLLENQHFMSESFRELSMGMTNDWQDAIEQGATFVRIGRAIFS